jgi:hypothetical protein
VYARYGITSHVTGQYEVDHLISLELGGSNSIKSLFPEAAEPRPGFHEKDRLENRLHKLVCAGKMKLKTAQRGIRTNWLKLYRRIFGSSATATARPLDISSFRLWIGSAGD